MGFMDKVKAQAGQVAKQGQEKLGEVQAKRHGDALLKDLGAWHHAVATGRDNGHGPAQIARITAELQAHEAEHGPLEVGAPPVQPDAPAPPEPPAPPAGEAPVPPAPPVPPEPPAPPLSEPPAPPAPGGPA